MSKDEFDQMLIREYILDNLPEFDFDIIYHYTSPDGFLGILDKESINLRFTRYDCVNDIEEGKNVIDCYKRACDELLETKEIDDIFYKNISTITPALRLFSYKNGKNSTYGIHSQGEKYLCCFSLAEDSLPMWNYYVKNGQYQGYCLGFDRELISESGSNKGYILQLRQVIYEDNIKTKIIKDLIKKLYEHREHDNALRQIESLLSIKLTQWQLVFKAECFKHEQEVRAVLTVPIKVPSEAEEVKEFTIEYRSNNGYVIPYTTHSFNKSYLENVTIGPLMEQEISKNTVCSLLDQRGYKDVRINNSEIPIRF